MKYKTPELTGLTPAINVIQGSTTKTPDFTLDNPDSHYETIAAYADWE